MNASKVQNLIWFAMLICYAAYKYLPGMQTWNTTYAIQVAIITILTAVVPYYATSFLASRMERLNSMIAIALLPTMLAITGYGLFYLVFIRANFPDVTAMQVLPRGILPGIAISALLATFHFTRPNPQEGPASES
jgi:hypothetical protein